MIQTIINADEIPPVALNFMNHTHQEEIELVNELGNIVKARQAGEETDKQISQLLDKWLEHTKVHFSRENKLMEEINFPPLPIHAEAHELALNEMQTIINTWNENNDIDQVENYIFNDWPAWFKAHVNSMDMMTAQFAVMNGYSND